MVTLTGKLIEFDKPNSNCHIYPREAFEKAVRDYNAKILKEERKNKLEKIKNGAKQ